MTQSEVGVYTVTAKVAAVSSEEEWSITVVYGPQVDQEKIQFLGELRWISHDVLDRWLLIGDFNLILRASDKSNATLNRRLMGAFRDLVQDLQLKELNLRGRKFTWSNDRTQTRIDRAFCTSQWDLMKPNVFLQALSSRVSDHCPLFIAGHATVKKHRGFRFEIFWPRLQGYHEVISEAWNKELHVVNPYLRLHTKMQRTSKALRKWARSMIGNNRVLMCAARMLIGILDVVQDFRQLSEQEIRLKRDLKVKFLGMTAVEKLRAKQAARLTTINAAETSSKLFYLQANGRRRKNFIQSIHVGTEIFSSHESKADAIFNHYSSLFGHPPERTTSLNWEAIGLQHHDLAHLEDEFTEEEIKAIVDDIAAEKAPGPDGYIGVFLKSSWQVIKSDILLALNYFYQQHDQHFHHLNKAHMVLLPKKEDAHMLSHFRPISLTHTIAKLISKLLATRLSAELNQLISRSQSAFIKRRSIHDNFLYTQNLVRDLQRRKQPGLFLKLDIAKAFDSVRWDYLMEVLEQFGFQSKWRAWVSILLATSSTSVILNGCKGNWFRHYTGLRQGDPLSPFLFIIAMEPLQRLLEIATQDGILSPIGGRVTRLRASLYADDAVVF